MNLGINSVLRNILLLGILRGLCLWLSSSLNEGWWESRRSGTLSSIRNSWSDVVKGNLWLVVHEVMNILVHTSLTEVLSLLLGSSWSESRFGTVWNESFLASLPVEDLGMWVGKPLDALINTIFTDIFSSTVLV